MKRLLEEKILLENEIFHIKNEINNINKINIHLSQVNQELLNKVNNTKQGYENLILRFHNSISWTIIVPLRIIYTNLKKIINFLLKKKQKGIYFF